MKSGFKTMLLAGAVTLLSGGTAIALDTFVVRAKIPFDFMVGEKRVAAGEYVVANDGTRGAVRISSRDTGSSMVTLRLPAGTNRNGYPYALVFQKYGSQYFLKEVWGGEGMAGAQLPASRAEKEAMARFFPEKTTLVAKASR